MSLVPEALLLALKFDEDELPLPDNESFTDKNNDDEDLDAATVGFTQPDGCLNN